jgi:hypothetical protein
VQTVVAGLKRVAGVDLVMPDERAVPPLQAAHRRGGREGVNFSLLDTLS